MRRWLWISFKFTRVTCATRYWATVSFPVPGKPFIWMMGWGVVPGMLRKSDVVEFIKMKRIWECVTNMYNNNKGDVKEGFVGR